MPYDAQGRWIEENEWQQMMREQAAQRVQAFSRYNDAPPSLYPNQAAPYGSFPYADPTPAIWDTSPDSILNPAVPSDPKYQGWGFNQEPIADTSAISNIPFISNAVAGPTVNKFTPVGSDYTPQQLNTPIKDLQQQNIPDNVVPLDPTGGLAATDPNLQGVTSMSMAQVVSPQTDQDYLDLGVTPPGWDITHPSQSPLLDQRYLEQPDKQTVTQDVTQAVTGTTGLGHTGGKTTAPFATDFLSNTVFPALTGEPFGPYNEAQKTVEDWKGLGLLSDWDAGVMKGHQLATVGAVPGSYTNTLGGGLANTVFSSLQPLDQIVDEWGTANPLASAWRGALGGTANLVGQMFGPPDTPVTAAYELMNQGVRPASHFAMDEQGVMAPALREMVTQVDEFGPLANSGITVQDMIDTAYNENIGMGQVASHPGQGGYIGDTERTIGEHLAAVNERVQAMPAVTTSQALSTQDERQQAMPTEVTKTKGPTKASVAAQARLAQQQADAAMRRAAQKAAAQDAARLAAQRAAVQADIAAAQAEQDRIRQANALMNSKSYQESGLDGLSAAERDIVAAAQVDTFAGIERQIRGDSDTAGERSAGMGGGRGGFAGPDRW